MLFLLLMSACDAPSPAWRPAEPRLRASTESLSFPATPLDGSSALELELSNLGESAAAVLISSSDPQFTADTPDILVPALSEVRATVRYAPTGSEASATLSLVLPNEVVTLEVSGVAEPDGDGDGYAHEALGGDDCDDTSPAHHPGAVEVWYDGVDGDCDGQDDDDADADGYAGGPDGDDCDDQDDSVHPRAVDVWYDGVDADCDGDSDYDADLDGFDAEPWGPDCDDDDARVNPDQVELWYDGVDRDCDGASDFDADGDGFDRPNRGDDCDDADASVHPGATEQIDGEDQDCDGLIDES